MSILKNPRHERFCQEVAQGKSGTQAYMAAGYKVTEKSAATLAYELLKNLEIENRIAELNTKVIERVVEKTGITLSEVIQEIAKIARAPLGDDYVKASDKRQACVDLGKHLGGFVERKEVGSPGEFENVADDELFREVQRAADLRTRRPRGKGTAKTHEPESLH